MSLAVIYSRAACGVHAPLVTVETHISNGLPGFSIVGLPETCIKESKDRVRSALINSHFEFPSKRITINLAPADLPKSGSRFDLPIALSILAASQQMPSLALRHYEFGGELALSGELRAIQGILPFALGTRAAQRTLMIPEANAEEASFPGDNSVIAAKHIREIVNHFYEQALLIPHKTTNTININSNFEYDMQDVQGQSHAKRALEIAAAGGHNLLMFGPPGTGKSMLASRLPSILPPLSIEEALDVMAIYSLMPSSFEKIPWGNRPFRNPHHSASSVALVGGGTIPRPGEISLAHHGILFLDEFPEFAKHVLEVLREPMETGQISISRAAQKTDFPAQFQLVAAMNPCPCGYAGDIKTQCRCTEEQIQRYLYRLSGPLLDRIDMHIEVTRLSNELLLSNSINNVSLTESSFCIRQRVIKAYELQKDRCNKPNARLTQPELKIHCQLNAEAQQLMQCGLDRLGLSARSYHRILKVARTIADLAGSVMIEATHLAEALSYRKREPRAR